MILFMLLSAGLTFAAVDTDPRLKIDSVGSCVETAKEFLRSNEYSDDDQKTALITACRDADPLCVKQVGENLSSGERSEAKTFLPLIRACKGQGTGGCYKALVENQPSYEHNEATEAAALLKKCE